MSTKTRMTPKKIIISPLNWGFGHAGRMIPLALELLKRGHEIIFCADRTVVHMLTRELPDINIIEIRGLHIRYFRKLPQWISVLLQLPHIIAASVREHSDLRRLVTEHAPDVIISDNRFGFRHRDIFSVYVTHQIRIPFPSPFRFIEPIGVWLHRKIIERFDLCLIPDYPGELNLSGRLSHGVRLPRNTVWSGPLSRFSTTGLTRLLPEFDLTELLSESDNSSITGSLSLAVNASAPAPVTDAPTPISAAPGPYCCLILSGPEPQRSILKEKVTAAATALHLVILDGTGAHNAVSRGENVTVVSNPDTALMKAIITGSSAVICRSGYTTLMELVSLRKGAIIIPTPGQPEQEYLGEYFDGKRGFVTLGQGEIPRIKDLAIRMSPEADQDQPFQILPLANHSSPGLPGSGFPGTGAPLSGIPKASQLLDAAIRRLTEEEI